MELLIHCIQYVFKYIVNTCRACIAGFKCAIMYKFSQCTIFPMYNVCYLIFPMYNYPNVCYLIFSMYNFSQYTIFLMCATWFPQCTIFPVYNFSQCIMCATWFSQSPLPPWFPTCSRATRPPDRQKVQGAGVHVYLIYIVFECFVFCTWFYTWALKKYTMGQVWMFP